jgi:SWI/SNF-related matrix-associated actin-dependent regulator 1 of chromatin subfamily A
VTACGTGLNLTRANIAVFAELAWSHGSVLQAEDRIHRIGQTSDVRVIYLLARDTSDEVMWRQMQSKHEVLASTIGTIRLYFIVN